MDWSYNSLSEPERVLLARLSVFVGGFTLDAAEEVCGDDLGDGVEIFDTLVGLIDKSLVDAHPTGGRYRLLETIRQYARERLLETGDANKLKVSRFLRRASRSAYDEHFGPSAERWLENLTADHANLRQALEWAIVSEAVDVAQNLAADLGWYWSAGGLFGEARDFLERCLTLAGGEQLPATVRCLAWASNFAAGGLDLQKADTFAAEGVSLARRLGDAELLAIALLAAAFCAQARNEYPKARARVDEALRLARDAGLLPHVAHAAFRGSAVAMLQSDAEAARLFGREALNAARLANENLVGGVLVGQALLASAFDDDHVIAAALLDGVVDQRRAAGVLDVIFVEACVYLGQELMELGELERARPSPRKRWQSRGDSFNAYDQILALTCLGNIEFAGGDPEEAVRHYRDAISKANNLHAPSMAVRPLHALARLAAADRSVRRCRTTPRGR